jgi:hypothetical protein
MLPIYSLSMNMLPPPPPADNDLSENMHDNENFNPKSLALDSQRQNQNQHSRHPRPPRRHHDSEQNQQNENEQENESNNNSSLNEHDSNHPRHKRNARRRHRFQEQEQNEQDEDPIMKIARFVDLFIAAPAVIFVVAIAFVGWCKALNHANPTQTQQVPSTNNNNQVVIEEVENNDEASEQTTTSTKYVFALVGQRKVYYAACIVASAVSLSLSALGISICYSLYSAREDEKQSAEMSGDRRSNSFRGPHRRRHHPSRDNNDQNETDNARTSLISDENEQQQQQPEIDQNYHQDFSRSSASIDLSIDDIINVPFGQHAIFALISSVLSISLLIVDFVYCDNKNDQDDSVGKNNHLRGDEEDSISLNQIKNLTSCTS